MTRKKRTALIAASAAGVLALSAPSLALAGPSLAPGPSLAHSGPEYGKPGGGWGGHMMSRMGRMGGHLMRGMHGRYTLGGARRGGARRGGARPIISLALRFRDDLKLTQDQIGKLTGLRDDYIRRSIGERAAVRTMRFDLRRALEADKVDLAATEKQIRAIAAKRADRRIDRLRTIEKGKAVLTKEQLTTLGGLIRQRHSGWMGHGGGSHGGGSHGGGHGMMGPGGGQGSGPEKAEPGKAPKRF